MKFRKRLYKRLVRLHGTPERVAGGVALGVFLGVAPTFGLGLVLAAGLSAWLRLNMAAAMLGSLAGAPPVIPLIWLASCFLGGWLLRLRWDALYAQVQAGEIWSAGGELLLAYVVGNVLLTVVLTGLAYLVTLALVRSHQRPRGRRG